jgi:hypothetical protein
LGDLFLYNGRPALLCALIGWGGGVIEVDRRVREFMHVPTGGMIKSDSFLSCPWPLFVLGNPIISVIKTDRNADSD